MSDNLETNPFLGLFSSVTDAQTVTQDSRTSIIESDNANKCGVPSTKPEENSDSISAKTEENMLINHIVEQVFNITLDKESVNRSNVPASHLLYLEEIATALKPQDWIDLETLEQALFERLLLEDPHKYIISRSGEKKINIDRHVSQTEVITYLYECHKRLTGLKCKEKDNHKNDILSQMIGFVSHNAALALRQPELFESQELHSQILALFSDTSISFSDLSVFFSGICQDFVQEEGEKEAINALCSAFRSTLDVIHRDMARSNLLTFNRSYFNLLHVFSANSHLASMLLVYCSPRDHRLGKAYADTLLGSILALSCLPKTQDGMYEFFEKPLQQVTSVVDGSIWTATEFITENLYRIFHNMLKCSNDVRNQTLNWLAGCLQSNTSRGKLWSAHAFHIGSTTCVSDGFMINLSAILLHLCHPFSANPNDVKLLRIDPTYCAATASGSEPDTSSKGVHIRELSSETCLIPVSEGCTRPVANNYGFVTECFFLAHRSLDLGFRVVYERLMRLNQDLARIQRAYNDAQNQAGAHSEVAQAIVERMEMEMTRYLSLRAALLEPSMLQKMVELHVATAVWLVQITLDLDEDGATRTSYNPTKFRELTFPLPERVPATLSCVPEFIMENTACFLSFIRRFSPRTLEEQGFLLLDPILTQVLVFMGSPQRMRNPHLRARMAECLESLLPHHSEEQPALNPNPLGSFFRERLFKEHPHRKQIVHCLLDVFVGIEMTGQSVQFEQKFNYRRPMYIVMDYLWQIEEHRECFKSLAAEAEANMEAVSPPLFLRFINLLMNDAVFLLDDALSNMAQLRQMQSAREAGEWRSLPAHEREQNEGFLQHTGMIARFDNILGRETIHTLEFLTSEITSIFCHPTMVERIAAMLNYFLLHLVGPNKKNFKVKDQKEYEFNPAGIVMDICKIYVHLYKSDAFCLAVSQDGRSYNPKLFSLAEDVLARIGGGALIADLQAAAEKVAQMAAHQQTEEVILAEAPDEFLDPIMSTIMYDPVILPSSRKTVDRSTIARHLLSDQTDPFNRSPLTMDMVKPNEDLREQIQNWIKERRSEHSTSTE
ncbi:ubiquitin conjugation factor E4 A [Anabrus simplex]|uniref:ubiquitin conjugation factor E4 A n=1 Tax=Anabrus simplex TaxID=316456 RepID=UPI0035A32F4E